MFTTRTPLDPTKINTTVKETPENISGEEALVYAMIATHKKDHDVSVLDDTGTPRTFALIPSDEQRVGWRCDAPASRWVLVEWDGDDLLIYYSWVTTWSAIQAVGTILQGFAQAMAISTETNPHGRG